MQSHASASHDAAPHILPPDPVPAATDDTVTRAQRVLNYAIERLKSDGMTEFADLLVVTYSGRTSAALKLQERQVILPADVAELLAGLTLLYQRYRTEFDIVAGEARRTMHDLLQDEEAPGPGEPIPLALLLNVMGHARRVRALAPVLMRDLPPAPRLQQLDIVGPPLADTPLSVAEVPTAKNQAAIIPEVDDTDDVKLRELGVEPGGYCAAYPDFAARVATLIADLTILEEDLRGRDEANTTVKHHALADDAEMSLRGLLGRARTSLLRGYVGPARVRVEAEDLLTKITDGKHPVLLAALCDLLDEMDSENEHDDAIASYVGKHSIESAFADYDGTKEQEPILRAMKARDEASAAAAQGGAL